MSCKPNVSGGGSTSLDLSLLGKSHACVRGMVPWLIFGNNCLLFPLPASPSPAILLECSPSVCRSTQHMICTSTYEFGQCSSSCRGLMWKKTRTCLLQALDGKVAFWRFPREDKMTVFSFLHLSYSRGLGWVGGSAAFRHAMAEGGKRRRRRRRRREGCNQNFCFDACVLVSLLCASLVMNGCF